MTSPRPVPRPMAVFAGGHWLRWAAEPWIVLAGLIAASLVAHALSRYLPWPTALGGGAKTGVSLVFSVAGCALAVALHLWARARTGRAELFADRLVVRHEGQLLHVVLPEVVVFDDRSADFVKVVLERAEWVQPRLTLTVPTPDDAARAALVSALASAGVPRDDGQDPPPAREPADLGDPILRVQGSRHAVVDLIWLLCLPALLVSWARADSIPALVAGALLTVGASIAAGAWSRPRTGRVWFLDERIVIDPMGVSTQPGWRCVVAWDDVVGWRSSSRAYLRLVLREGLLRDTHGEPSVPTPTPEDRAAVEALLATRGVPRL